MGEKFGEFGELFVIRQTKTIQLIVLTIDNLLADLLIRQTFFRQTFSLVNYIQII